MGGDSCTMGPVKGALIHLAGGQIECFSGSISNCCDDGKVHDSGLRAKLVVDLSKAANAHLDLGMVLEALCTGLSPQIHFSAIAVEIIEGEYFRLHSLHLAGMKRIPGEPMAEMVARHRGEDIREVESRMRERTRVDDSCIGELIRQRTLYVCTNLAVQKRFAEEEVFLTYGVGAYVCIGLGKGAEFTGALYLTTDSPRDFSPYELRLLEDVSEIISIAVSNALAYEEIRSLKERLQEENLMLRDEIVERSMYEEIVGSSAPLRQVLKAIEKVAPTDSTVIISGETGTGKELLARAIHRRSARAGRTLVSINCAALPAELIGSELFGHEKGAFTGALQQRVGRFETADGGTIFLDEIGELRPEMQVLLLRVLQEKEYQRVGSNVTRRTDVRVIAATNRDLSKEVAEGRFRSDLYYRLNVFPIEAPPLRARRDDIPVLVEYFAGRFANRMGKRIRTIEKTTLSRLQNYSWPGNIRELQNIVERAVILAEGDVLRVEAGLLRDEGGLDGVAPAGNEWGDQREAIENALAGVGGRISGPRGAAARLGIPASTLESRIRALGINKHLFRNRL